MFAKANIPFLLRDEPVFAVQTRGMNTTAKGDIAEQAVVLALMAAGKPVLKSISNGLRCDLVVDNLDGSFTLVFNARRASKTLRWDIPRSCGPARR